MRQLPRIWTSWRIFRTAKETPNRVNYSNSSKLVFTSSPSLPRASSSLRFRLLFFSHVNVRTSTAIVSTLPERITIAAFYPRRERGPRTFLKFWWPPPGGHRLPLGYNPYELLVLLQAVVPFVSCASLVDAPPHRWSSIGSPLRVPVCLLKSFVYTNGVLAVDKPAPCVCVMCIQAHIRENTRGRGRGRKKRDGENERKMMCTYAPLASSSGPRRSWTTIELREMFRHGSKAPKVPIPTVECGGSLGI